LQHFLNQPRDTGGFRETGPPAVILDTDIGPDYDDVGTLALFHAFADRGELKPLATVSSNAYERTAPVLSAVNTYYGRPDLPIGVTRREEPYKVDRQGWAKFLLDRYPHPVAGNQDAEDAVALYRRLLAASPDTSVTIVTVGFFTNLADLLDSPADEHSSLPGRELVARKVDRLVSMAARLDEGKTSGREFNVYVDAAAARRVLADWPRPITLSPFELGVQVRTGISLTERDDLGKHPVQDAYRVALAADNNDRGRMSWDQTALLAAVRGEHPYFSSRMLDLVIEDDGSNRLVTGERLRYLSLAQSPEQVAAVIEALMAHTPTTR
jgi:inosine-uridine nucleoside N-ribohydrolase